MEKEKICAVFGETPDELEFGYDEEYYTCAEMKYRLVKAMESALLSGYNAFASTLDQGAAMWGAEACAAIKKLGGKVSLLLAPLSDDQADRWHPERRDRYFCLLEDADEIIEPAGALFGEEYILDAADRIIILGSCEHPRLCKLRERALTLGKEVVLV